MVFPMRVKNLPWEESVMVKREARMVRGSMMRDQTASRAPRWVLNSNFETLFMTKTSTSRVWESLVARAALLGGRGGHVVALPE